MPRKPTGRPRGRPIGSGAVLEREQTRLTVRIPETLYDRLEAHAEGLHFTRGTPQLAGAVRALLEHALACPYKQQTETIPLSIENNSGQTENMLALPGAAHTAEEQTVQPDRETVAPSAASDDARQTEKRTRLLAQDTAQRGDTFGQTENKTSLQERLDIQAEESTWQTENVLADVLDYDTSRYQLGRLCPHGHDSLGTGQSLRRTRDNECLACQRERSKAVRQRKRLVRSGA